MEDQKPSADAPPLTIRLLGDVSITCGEAPRALPKSRKTRALLAYLAVEAGPHRRDKLCELLWQSAADPRAALRWSLAKLRPLLEAPTGQALQADAGSIGLDRQLIAVDVLQARALLEQAPEGLSDAQLGSIETALAAGFPHDLDLAASDRYQLWIEGEREVARSLHRRVLDEQAARASQGDEALARARKRAAHDPLDTVANAHLLARSAEVDGHRHARTAFDAMRARYRAEGVSDHALVAAWRRLDDDSPLVLPDKPSVAVLGFADLGARHTRALDPVLAEGLAADLTAMLGRLRGLFVTARASIRAIEQMGHWTVGHCALFLARQHDPALQAIDRSLLANPNFAQGHYALGFIRAHVGAGLQALPELAAAERLSPYDPLLFAMESSRAISLAIGGHYADAAQWSVRATREPNAHFHIHAIAAACLALAGREAESKGFALRACNDHPGYSVRVFERSFPHKHPEHRDMMASALQMAGIPVAAGCG